MDICSIHYRGEAKNLLRIQLESSFSGRELDEEVAALGVRVVRTPVRAPLKRAANATGYQMAV